MPTRLRKAYVAHYKRPADIHTVHLGAFPARLNN